MPSEDEMTIDERRKYLTEATGTLPQSSTQRARATLTGDAGGDRLASQEFDALNEHQEPGTQQAPDAATPAAIASRPSR